MALLASVLQVVDAQRQRRSRKTQERDITPEEVEQITDDATIVDDEEARKYVADQNAEYREYFESDFSPEEMLQVVIDPRSELAMHEDAPAESVYMRGMFYVNGSDRIKRDKTIDFFILDPAYKVIYSRRKQVEGMFRINTEKEGQYTFVFSNMKDRIEKKTVTLLINPGREIEEPKSETQLAKELQQDEDMAKAAGVDVSEIQHLESLLKKTSKQSKNLLSEVKMLQERQS